jgi:hypothetical protein
MTSALGFFLALTAVAMSAVGLVLATDYRGFVTWSAKRDSERFASGPAMTEFSKFIGRLVGIGFTLGGVFALFEAIYGHIGHAGH